MEASYWRERLFKNTFTYQGKQVEVSNWSVKIQHLGQRKTFSLRSGRPAQAAAEALQIYRALVSAGWEAVAHRRHQPNPEISAVPGQFVGRGGNELHADWWVRRLIHRRYTEELHPHADRHLSVRIDHAGTSQYFPLGTDKRTVGAKRATRIYRTILKQGWEAAKERFSRELTVAFRWVENPLAWTYTTLQTQRKVNSPAVGLWGALSSDLSVAIVEPDAGVRQALAWSINGQPGFRLEAAFPNTVEALREIPRRRLQLVLINHSFGDKPGAACLEELERLARGTIGLLYSLFEDSDQLFRDAPGGARGYALVRTGPRDIFAPIAGTLEQGLDLRDQIAGRVRDYFQGLFGSIAVGGSVTKLGKLTPREHQVLAQLSKGYLSKEIAESLRISVWTVQGHFKNIFEKLKVHNRTEAVVKYLHK